MTLPEPSKAIAPPAWMTTPALKRVLSALDPRSKGAALLVGGCVRNALLGYPVKDIDIATIHPPAQCAKILARAGIKTVPTGIDHGTITAVIDGKGYEITTLRRDIETDGRRAVIAFTDDWREDAMRRDFTINTLLADMAGQIYDPLGTGLADIKARRVRFVGNPDERITEDYLRILRFFRFHAAFGRGAPDRTAIAACKRHARHVMDLSRERITQEWMRIIALDNAAETVALMFGCGVLRDLKFRGFDPAVLKTICTIQKRIDQNAFSENIPARLWIVAAGKKKNIGAMNEILVLPKILRRDLDTLAHAIADDFPLNENGLRRSIYLHGKITTARRLMIGAAQGNLTFTRIKKFITLLTHVKQPVFPVNGADLIHAGYTPGPQLGAAIQNLETLWIESNFKLSRKNLIKIMTSKNNPRKN